MRELSTSFLHRCVPRAWLSIGLRVAVTIVVAPRCSSLLTLLRPRQVVEMFVVVSTLYAPLGLVIEVSAWCRGGFVPRNRTAPDKGVPSFERVANMIAVAQRRRAKAASAGQNDLFVSMLPQIVGQAEYALRRVPAEAREELVQEAISQAYGMFASLCRRGQTSLAYATPLTKFAIRHVRAGRRFGSSVNARDVTSLSGRASSGVAIKRLDQFDRRKGEWREVLVEDRTAGQAEIAAARINCATWLGSLSRRQRAIACTLASGESTGRTARKFGLSAARISQLRAWLHEHWRRFHCLEMEDSLAPA
jgi:hypothetical protein